MKLALFLLSIVVQSQSCSIGTSQDTFDSCKNNALYDSSANTGQASVEAFCQGSMGNQGQYYNCLCKASEQILFCYSNFCSGDSTIGTWQNQRTSYCQAAQQYQPTTTTVSITSSARSATATGTNGPIAQPPKSNGQLPLGLSGMIGLMGLFAL